MMVAWRALIGGERAMVALLFGAAIDVDRVRIYSRRYLPFGLQPVGCAMAPNGHIYFHQSRCLDDFSSGSAAARHWFMHEMSHVWQFQLGYPVRLRGALRLGLRYRYELAMDKTLSDYNMEAQGELLADYFVLRHLGAPQAMRQGAYANARALYEQVLAGFLADPANRENLPKGILLRLR